MEDRKKENWFFGYMLTAGLLISSFTISSAVSTHQSYTDLKANNTMISKNDPYMLEKKLGIVANSLTGAGALSISLLVGGMLIGRSAANPQKEEAPSP